MPDYIALLRKEPDSDYGVDFPDFPGCVTAGATLDEARRMAEEALRFHIDGIIEDGEDIPRPSSLEGVMADETNRDAVAFLVSVPERQGRVVRVNITLPENVLAEVDRFVSERGLTRSGFLARAAEKALKDSV